MQVSCMNLSIIAWFGRCDEFTYLFDVYVRLVVRMAKLGECMLRHENKSRSLNKQMVYVICLVLCLNLEMMFSIHL